MVARGWARLRDRLGGLARQALRALRVARSERELDEEHAFHIDMETERLVRAGVSPREARRRALVAFGGVERFQQQVREGRWTWVWEEGWRDARHALRGLARRPLLAVSAVGTMGVAIGAATTFFSGVESVLLRPLPVPAPDRLVGVSILTESGGRSGVVSLPDYLDYRDGAAAVVDLAAHHLSDVTLSNEGGALASLGLEVSSNYFGVLDLVPATGRFFQPGEAERLDGPREVVLSHEVWRSRFAEDPGVVGRPLYVNGKELTIVGVAPEGFHGTMLGARPAVFLPLGQYGRLQGRDIGDRTGTSWLQLFGRLGGGASPEQATDALDATARGLGAAYAYGREPVGARVEPFSPLPARQRAVAAQALLILLSAAGVLLLIAAINVSGMLLVRASQREREIAMRRALGAGRSRLVGQLLVEGLVLGILAGASGAGVALLGTRLLERVRPPGLPGFRLDLPVDGAVLAFVVVSAFLVSLLFGLLPASHALRPDPGPVVRHGAARRPATRGRSVLVATQVALTLVLLVSTMLLLRTLRAALGTDHGFDSRGLVLAELNLRLNGYDREGGEAFYRALLESLRASPEVASAALSTSIPLGEGWDQTRASVPGLEAPEASGWVVGWSAVSEGYFETLGFAFRGGSEPDPTSMPPRIVVNDALARLFWPDEAPVGRGFRFDGREAEVSGVVPTGKYRSLSEEPTLFAWVPLAFAPSPSLYVHVRPRTDGPAAVGAIRRSVASLDPHVPLIRVTTLETAMGQSLFFQRVAAAFIGAFASVALLLSATGIFGLLAYTVEQSRREIGIRIAVGASGSGVVRTVVRAAVTPVLIGLLAGLGGALASARVLGSLLYGVPATDPTSFTAAGLLLLTVGLVAAWTPARRATRVDPTLALRAE